MRTLGGTHDLGNLGEQRTELNDVGFGPLDYCVTLFPARRCSERPMHASYEKYCEMETPLLSVDVTKSPCEQ
jgi:hypothetical protein